VHELSICAAIAGIANRYAAGRPVSVINVRVGEWRQVVPDTLAYCWSLFSADTPLAGSVLAVERVAGEEFLVTSLDLAEAPVFNTVEASR
jgi:hydrogenase nickel incorporation protein HypA/HybF